MKEKKAFIIGGIFLIAWGVFGYSTSKLLKEDHILTHGTVSSIGKGGKGNRGPDPATRSVKS